MTTEVTSTSRKIQEAIEVVLQALNRASDEHEHQAQRILSDVVTLLNEARTHTVSYQLTLAGKFLDES